ncbi:MAG: VPLPA-CTERM sorting domain-containing protein [Gammaproteobacteria bacterium]|nr:VPLPA-CTERM sorting domain-containing protein [Gammaproteobacteria bacterium]
MQFEKQMLEYKFRCLCAAFMLVSAFASPATASTIVGAVGVSSPQGSFPTAGFALDNIINQNGLSSSYTSGITDFDSYIASVIHDGTGSGTSGFTNGECALPPDPCGGQISLDLGLAIEIDALVFWGTDTNGSILSFNLYADSDQDYTNGAGTLLGEFTPAGDGDVLAFGGAVLTQFIHIDVLSINDTTPLTNTKPGMGEVAFRSSSVVPVPAAVWLFASGLIGMVGVARTRTS